VDAQWAALHQQVIGCRACPRLVAWREEVARTKRRAFREWDYWGRPVAGFGDLNARLMAVGLAPGAHGSNRTGRVFTGDSSGDFLYPALYRAGFASQPDSVHAGDGMTLTDLYIGAVCRCVPPDNRPLPEEMDTCAPFLAAELALLARLQGIVLLGQIAFDRLLRLLRQRGAEVPALKFGHGAFFELGSGLPWLLCSYHPSRQNTQTGRLTVEMFDRIWLEARDRLS
jgi:uracil-DNA glycosylase family 4